MNKKELLEKLNDLVEKSEIYAINPFRVEGDPSDWHEEADHLLISYINDKEITNAFYEIERWYD